MTVQELIEKLEEVPLDAKVTVDGCQSCIHVITGVEEPEDAASFPSFWENWIGDAKKIVNIRIDVSLP